jgi:hypothetical protein
MLVLGFVYRTVTRVPLSELISKGVTGRYTYFCSDGRALCPVNFVLRVTTHCTRSNVPCADRTREDACDQTATSSLSSKITATPCILLAEQLPVLKRAEKWTEPGGSSSLWIAGIIYQTARRNILQNRSSTRQNLEAVYHAFFCKLHETFNNKHTH